MAATARPWTYDRGRRRYELYSEKTGEFIGEVRSFDEDGDFDEARARVNAALIVRAVNTHEGEVKEV